MGEGGGHRAPWGRWAVLGHSCAVSLSAVNHRGAVRVQNGWKSGEVPAVMPGEGVPGGACRELGKAAPTLLLFLVPLVNSGP